MSTRYNIIGFALPLVVLLGIEASPSRGAVITYTQVAYAADSNIATDGTLVEAIKLGNTTTDVTVNGVTFVHSPSTTNNFYVSGGTISASTNFYSGGAIGSLTLAQTDTLLQSLEFGSGVGNSLARLTGLTIGQQYKIQLIEQDAHVAGVKTDYGYEAATGVGPEVYPLTAIDMTTPHVITGTFTADQTSQDVEVQLSGGTNGETNAFQLRAVPEPSAICLSVFLAAGLLMRRRSAAN